MGSDYLLAKRLNEVEVVADLTLDFSAIDQEKELGLDTGIEISLDVPVLVAIDSNMSKSRVFSSKVLIVFLNLCTFWVPAG